MSFSKHVRYYACEQLSFFFLDIKQIQGEEGMNNKLWMFLGLSVLSLQGPYFQYICFLSVTSELYASVFLSG